MKKATYIIAAFLVALSLGAIPVSGFYRINVFYSPLFFILALVTAISPLFFQFKKRTIIRQLTFIFTHYGVLIILLGVILEFTPIKKEGSLLLKENSDKTTSFQTKKGDLYKIPFSIKLETAEILYYPPSEYDLYRYDSYYKETVFVKKVSAQYLEQNRNRIEKKEGEIIYFNDASLLYLPKTSKMVSEYRANVLISGKNKLLRVNHPLYEKGYIIYLISMRENDKGEHEVTLLLRKNPGSIITLLGMFFVLFGLFLFSIKRERKLKNDI
ncbi:MAG: cytochrome c biogenesis protein ResB [Psychrilyobacter sp.]|nr:cytochrome c biogenesis protein ResB [Psychrilyobacter sp.]